jgi:hypothetical protein
MAVASETIEDANKEGTLLEKHVNSHVGNFIHMFLTVLAVLVMAVGTALSWRARARGYDVVDLAPEDLK